LTREALELYFQHLSEEGILAIHISNRYLDLRPVVLGIAEERNVQSRVVTSPGDILKYAFLSRWVLLSRHPDALNHPGIVEASTHDPEIKTIRTWTDNYSNLLHVLK